MTQKGGTVGLREALAALVRPAHAGNQIEVVRSYLGEAVNGMTAEDLYRSQPHLRTVVSFLARNVAHLGMPVFARKSDTDREKLRDDPLAKLLRFPNPTRTRYEVIEALVSDIGLYDRAYWMVTPDSRRPSGWLLQPIPPAWVVEYRGGGAFAVDEYVIGRPGHERIEVPAKYMIEFHGWNPDRPKRGTSPVDTLRNVLAEQVSAWEYRNQVWKRGGRASHVIKRGAGKDWSDAARRRFATDWRQSWSGRGDEAGGTPILEDGMEIQQLGFSAREDEWAEVSKVALSTVASVYHVNPVMVGILDNANFSNTKEFRKMLYSETLGPLLAMIEDRINTFLAPLVSDEADVYVEFNIAEKLQGDFEEQAKIMSTAVGGPWLSRNEARAMQNYAPVEGGDDLITPLNVLVGGQASPHDGTTAGGGALGMLAGVDAAKDLQARVSSATALIRNGFDPAASLLAVGLDPIQHLGLLPVTVQKPTNPDGSVDAELVAEVEKARAFLAKSAGGPVRVKATLAEGDAESLADSMSRFFERQRAAVLSAMGAKSPDWWNGERWNTELVADLLDAVEAMSTKAARDMLAEAGVDSELYKPEQAKAFLRAAVELRAGKVNDATLAQLEAILAGEGPDGVSDPAHVFDVAEGSRAEQIGLTLATFIAAFATVEAAKQSGASGKTWITTSGNPRPEHAAMNGETVPVGEKFSNGADWPGDQALGVDGIAGCECEVQVTYG